jgi:catechol 2,3-dioxygenase-like lactoylglutathione lyase family enzyme
MSPGFDGLLETSLYYSAAEGERIERFYTETLGLRIVSSWKGALALRVGAGLLLLFERESLGERDSPMAAHGSDGPGHVCLLATGEGEYTAWRKRLTAAGVEITLEHEWDSGERSLYFVDPAGNLLEIADGDLWPR